MLYSETNRKDDGVNAVRLQAGVLEVRRTTTRTTTQCVRRIIVDAFSFFRSPTVALTTQQCCCVANEPINGNDVAMHERAYTAGTLFFYN